MKQKKVVFVEIISSILRLQKCGILGVRKVPCLERYPQFRGSGIEGFHSTHCLDPSVSGIHTATAITQRRKLTRQGRLKGNLVRNSRTTGSVEHSKTFRAIRASAYVTCS